MRLLKIFSVLLLPKLLDGRWSDWITRTLNQRADYYSKIVDYEDWCVSSDYFRNVDSRWGPFTEDCFASYANAKLPRFYLRFYDPNTLRVDMLLVIAGKVKAAGWSLPFSLSPKLLSI